MGAISYANMGVLIVLEGASPFSEDQVSRAYCRTTQAFLTNAYYGTSAGERVHGSKSRGCVYSTQPRARGVSSHRSTLPNAENVNRHVWTVSADQSMLCVSFQSLLFVFFGCSCSSCEELCVCVGEWVGDLIVCLCVCLFFVVFFSVCELEACNKIFVVFFRRCRAGP